MTWNDRSLVLCTNPQYSKPKFIYECELFLRVALCMGRHKLVPKDRFLKRLQCAFFLLAFESGEQNITTSLY